ncbi:MAG: hypothetical protein V9G12_04085 [Microthrixaceae bacterium]
MNDEHHDFRGYAGSVAGGVFKPGDEVVVLPSGLPTKIAGSTRSTARSPRPSPPMSVTLLLEDDIDISRGDMICRPNNQPTSGQDIEAMVCWMTEQSARRAPSSRSSTRPAPGVRS